MKKKMRYIAPIFFAEMLELENNIAAGSASIIPTTNNNIIQEEWEVGKDDSRTIDW